LNAMANDKSFHLKKTSHSDRSWVLPQYNGIDFD